MHRNLCIARRFTQRPAAQRGGGPHHLARCQDAADKAAKAAAYFAFWSFMALLFGAVAATVGGNQRDDDLVPDAG